MINLENLPIDITKQINYFREFLISSWPCFLDIIEDHDWDNTESDPFHTWIQACWEILFQKSLIGNTLTMSSLSGGWKDNSIIQPGTKPAYTIIGKTNNNIKEIRSQCNISELEVLRLYSLITYDRLNHCYGIGPPFDIAALIDDKNKKDYYFHVDSMHFFLYPISILNKGM